MHLAVGEGKAIRVGDNLQEDVHAVENGGESWVLAIVLCDLEWGFGAERQSGPGWASARLGRYIDTHPWPPSTGCKGPLWALDTHASSAPQAYLLCKPYPTGLSDPLAGMDARVDPDGRTVVSPGAKLDKKSRQMGQLRLIPPPRREMCPCPEATCSLGITG